MLPQFWVTLRKIITLNTQNTILICNKTKQSIKHKYPLVLNVSPNVVNSPIHCIHFKPTKRDFKGKVPKYPRRALHLSGSEDRFGGGG